MKCERYCCEDISNIENFQLAKNDNFKGWICHHRLELVSTGAVVSSTQKDLKDWGIYYNRQADELIFLTRAEHVKIHNAERSKETLIKISEASKGNQYRNGKPAWNKGKHASEESKEKMSEAKKGKHWKLVDGKRVWY